MKDINAFLYGKAVARKMQAIEHALKALEDKHQSYFAGQRSRYAAEGEIKAATLSEFVQPQWVNLQPSLWVDPTLPPSIAAECVAYFNAAIS